MFKLQELVVIKLLEEPRYILGSGTIFIIEILQPKFDNLYHSYESSISHQETGEKIRKAKTLMTILNNEFTPPYFRKSEPTLVKIVEMPEIKGELKIAGLQMPLPTKRTRQTIELSFPESVQWDKVTLKIKEGRQEVEIFYDNSHIITADYRQLRFFVGKKQQKPNRQWGFLCALATLAATGIQQATAESMRNMITQNKTLSANNVQQVKKLFAERLQDIFKTSDDPFHDRREYYKPKFKILPEPALRREEIWSQGGRLNENRGDETDRHAYERKRTQEENKETP